MKYVCFTSVGCKSSLLLSILFLLTMAPDLWCKGQRQIRPAAGYTRAEALAINFNAVVDSMRIVVYDALEGSKTYSEMDESLYELANKLHIESTHPTIRKRLLFKEGTQVTRELLLESERILRQEEFLADAMIEVKIKEGELVDIIVTAVDQWTTTLPIGVQRLGSEWVYFIGVLETNLAGTGQKLGFFYGHDIDRNTYWAHYDNRAFLFNRLHLAALGGRSTDGYMYNFSLGRALSSKSDKWGFSISSKGFKQSKFYYLDADRPQDVQFWGAGYLKPGFTSYTPVIKKDDANLLFTFKDVVDLNMDAGLNRSYGLKHRFIWGLSLSWRERYIDGPSDNFVSSVRLYPDSVYQFNQPPATLALDIRQDYLAGLKLTYSQKEYKTVKNFRNLKWSEDIDVGFSLSMGVFQNMGFMGAKNSDLFLTHDLVYINTWLNQHFFTTNFSSQYFLSSNGEFEDGTNIQAFEYQWKPIPATSSYFASTWTNYFAREKSAQLLLGEEFGLNGYPNRFFAGQAKYLGELEQRFFFPEAEFGTAVPAVAVFLNAGNAFPSYRDFEWDSVHYSGGIGLRIGLSRSTQKVVNHINVSWPLDSKYRDILSWKISLRAKATL